VTRQNTSEDSSAPPSGLVCTVYSMTRTVTAGPSPGRGGFSSARYVPSGSTFTGLSVKLAEARHRMCALVASTARARDQDGPDRRRQGADWDRSVRQDQNGPGPGPQHRHASTRPGLRPAGPQMDQARVIARRLAAAGKPVSRRALRSGGVTGSNETLNALARMISTELAGCAGSG
jgi:hypothetical protein